eukprot:TRINITY_DN11280_c0_g1_i1.p1 TRINITY_DN11280_c0_g1~~TRINITY_DN11280_c0_g1_i1.p1  ORF type:complete len:373 (+),score=104.91 TRINITY_DN11280_c0_g1_i1:50-1168(+)
MNSLTMKAVRLTQYSAPGSYRDDLVLAEDVPVPEPTKKQMRIKVLRAALHAGDLRIADGIASKLMSVSFPFTVGMHFAGVVDKIPDNAPRDVKQKWKVGDRVAGMAGVLGGGTGTFAEYCCALTSSCAHIPDGIGFDCAAALPTTAGVAHQGFENMGLTAANGPNKSLLVLGGTTGCGLGFLSLAKAYGVRDIVCTSGSAELAKQAGATEVVDYRQAGGWSAALDGRQFDYVVNTVEPVDAWYKSCALLRKGGLYLTQCFDDASPKAPVTVGQVIAQMGRVLCRKVASWFGRPSFVLLMVDEEGDHGLAQFLSLTAEGGCMSFVSPASPFALTAEGVAQMHETQAQGSVKGRHVVSIADYVSPPAPKEALRT